MPKKTKTQNSFLGRWRIISMSGWDNEYLDEEIKAFIEFAAGGRGSFHFGYVQGVIDHRRTNRGGEPAVEFSWEGGDEADGTPLTGRGWAMHAEGGLKGMFYIHDGDDSDFVAKQSGANRRKAAGGAYAHS